METLACWDAPTVQFLIEQAADRYADQPALRLGEQSVTYRWLNERADALSRLIRTRDSAADRIGVSTTRGFDLVVHVLAVLKAGKAYLPLDPTYPEPRLRQITADSGVQTVLAPAADAPLFERLGLRVRSAADGAEAPAGPTTPAGAGAAAYVLYTSGSTGTPKGVSMGHGPLVNLLRWQAGQSSAGVGDRTLQLAPLSFDVSFQEIFATLTTGGTLVLVDEATRLDLTALLTYIRGQGINRLFLPFVALQYVAELAVSSGLLPTALREVITAGEQLKITPPIRAFFQALPHCTLFNQYGPTECHVVTQLTLRGNPADWPALPTIGGPIDHVTVYITGETGTVLMDGDAGEICLGGACLADGYVNQPALTNQKFVQLTLPTGESVRVYRTGDLGRQLPDGTIEFLGRRDDQVKIRGHRVELGEIEVVLSQTPGIRQAVVVARDGTDGLPQLVAYLVATSQPADPALVRNAITGRLPEYMLPSAFVWLDELPRTSSGKVDRKQLPEPPRHRPALTVPYRRPKSAPEQTIAGIWADLLRIDEIGLDDNFFELGGNSLLAQKMVAALHPYGYALPVTKLYQFPTVAGLARYVGASPGAAVDTTPTTEPTGELSTHAPIAIIGMAGRFPGANSPAELWDVLTQGRETIQFFTDDELDGSIPDRLRHDPRYVRARGILADADRFDAHFFGLPPALAQVMDPQQRVFLEIAYEALEQTGYLPAHYSGRVGVFAGCGNNTYYPNNVLAHPDRVEQVGPYQVMSLNEKDYIASRTAYQLNLTGPAVGVYSACSTSLLAVAQAVQSLRSGQCAVALAGGASVTSPIRSGHLYEDGAMLSRDGHCRSFDADAQGTVFSDGAGVVLLKPLDAARRDGDTIWGVIRGVGVNNDGGGKGSFTAPSAEGQAGAIRMALADARVDAATIRYVEAHGTATPVGDPIEIDGLRLAFGESAQKQYCAIGSLKSNLGHLTAAAGVAGLIKTTLALHHRQLPPSIHVSQPNPVIDFTNSPFYVQTELTDWLATGTLPRRAGVSSFGVGGTNVHVVLEEYVPDTPLPAPTEPPTDESSESNERPVQLLTWSAKSAVSRDQYAERLADTVSNDVSGSLADAAFTLQTTRPAYAHRRFAVAATPAELADLCRSIPQPPGETGAKPPGEVAFLFPGQGAQYVNMGRAFYEREVVFRRAVDHCAELLAAHLDTDIRRVLYPETGDSTAEARLNNTRYAQPALFVTEYALAQLWMSWGIEPTVFCGHSLGEFVAAHLAGVFSLADALRLVAVRGRLMGELPRGSMLSVRLAPDAVRALLPPTLAMAAVNSRSWCVVAGPDEHVADFTRQLDERELPNRLLPTSHAFHSAMMEPVVGPFADAVAQLQLNRPHKPIVSTATGTFLTDAEATDPRYWAGHLRRTVCFADALDTLFSLDQPLLLEVGPGRACSTFARQQAPKQAVRVLGGLPSETDPPGQYRTLLTTLGQLYQHGLNPDWRAFYAGQPRRRVLLPAYAFDRQRCWLDPATPAPAPTKAPVPHVVSFPEPLTPTMPTQTTTRLHRLLHLLEDASGLDLETVRPEMSFLQIGLDSLLLTQIAISIRNEFGVPVTFRQLTNQYDTPARLAAHLDAVLPAESPSPTSQPTPILISEPPAASAPAADAAPTPANDSALGLIAQQLQLLAKQVALLQRSPNGAAFAAPTGTLAPVQPTGTQPPPAASIGTFPTAPAAAEALALTPEEAAELKKPFGATARIDRQTTELTPSQQAFLQALTERYTRKTARSKAYAQQHRPSMADPRVVSGFRPATKELVYPLVVNRSAGSRLWDIDGNEYIDALNGFGSNLFGYQPDWVKQALHEQIENGFEIGPQHELAGPVCALIGELTGSERVALCNTGSEAVLGAMRIARTVTGRSLIVAFTGSYHGIADEVLVRGTKQLKSFPAAAGILPEAVQNMLILDYGTDESLRILRERAGELAAVLVEPVQSRRPEFVPVGFLREVRRITAESGTALIFDEVITGFRTHPGGAQALFDIRADLVTYGKVVGAGLPIGVIGGKSEFMDALDGGFWQYGDASVPEAGVTYFAGTFVRHPLALAAAHASLSYLKAAGPGLQRALTHLTNQLADALNAVFRRRQLPLFVAHFGSLWKIKFTEDVPYGELLFTLLREKGIHIWDGFPCFMTESHTPAEIETLIEGVTESADALVAAGFLTASAAVSRPTGRPDEADMTKAGAILTQLNTPPVPGARLGRDRAGNPAWFLPIPEQPGEYLQIESDERLNRWQTTLLSQT